MATEKEIDEKLRQILQLMDMVIGDNSIPKNVRKNVGEAKEKLETDEELIVRTGGAVYILEESGSDINLPAHARTQIWTILSALESINE